MSVLVKLSKINKVYKTGTIPFPALKNVNLEIKKGDFLAVIGASGSGKSTLLNIIGLLDKPFAGIYELDGQKTAIFTEDMLAKIRNEKIGFVFQSFNLLPRTSALENVAMPLIYAGISADVRRERAKIALELEIMRIFQRLNKEGKTIIMITHEADIAKYAKKRLKIKDGRIWKA